MGKYIIVKLFKIESELTIVEEVLVGRAPNIARLNKSSSLSSWSASCAQFSRGDSMSDFVMNKELTVPVDDDLWQQ